MKTKLIFLFFIVTFCSCDQSLENANSNHDRKIVTIKINKDDFNVKHFTPIPKALINEGTEFLIDKIKPNVKYKYWECVYKSPGLDSTNINFNKRGNIVCYQGDSLKYSSLAKKVDSYDGFFGGALPIYFYYIIGIKENNEIDLINTEVKFKSFIGNIDNLEEVLLSSQLNKYWFDSTNIIGGSFKEKPNYYLLYLLDYDGCPETYSSVKAVLTKKGKFITLSKKSYKKTDDCTIE